MPASIARLIGLTELLTYEVAARQLAQLKDIYSESYGQLNADSTDKVEG